MLFVKRSFVLFSCSKLQDLSNETRQFKFYWAIFCHDRIVFLLLSLKKKRKKTKQWCRTSLSGNARGRLISWLNIIGSIFVLLTFWLVHSFYFTTYRSWSLLVLQHGSLVSRERSKSHFLLSQTAHVFLKRRFLDQRERYSHP